MHMYHRPAWWPQRLQQGIGFPGTEVHMDKSLHVHADSCPEYFGGRGALYIFNSEPFLQAPLSCSWVPPPFFENFLIKWKVLSFSSLKMSSPHLYSWGVTWHVTVNRLIIIFFQCVRDTPALASVCGYFRWWVSDGMNFWCAIFFWLLVRLFNFQ